MHQCIKFILFWNDNLHVSDGLSVHHQQFKTVHTATGICQTDTADCLLAGTFLMYSPCDSKACGFCAGKYLQAKTVNECSIIQIKETVFDEYLFL